MHAIHFIQDLAIIMLLSGIVSVVFYKLKQPVVLGYILVGVIIGPHTPPFQLVQDRETIAILAELGVVFLLFTLGLEFSLRKLLRVGSTALIAAVSEIVVMVLLGREIGRFFGWSTMDSLFLGAILSISSTTIIVKALDELNVKRERFAQLVVGVLIVEDILAIAIIAVLSGVAKGDGVVMTNVAETLGMLVLFLVMSLVIGLLTVPHLLNRIAAKKKDELLLVAALGLCFGFCLLVSKMGYSIALGAFVIGAIMAESKSIQKIEDLMRPLRDMFSAIFFVSIGLLLDPGALRENAVPILVITLAVIGGKLFSCGFGALVAGNDGRTSMRVGMSLSQIGEFSFIIASLGLSLKVTSEFLYPVTVAVSALTTLTTPYLIRASDPLSDFLSPRIPAPVANVVDMYAKWRRNTRPAKQKEQIVKILRKMVIQLAVNVCFVIGIYLGIPLILARFPFLPGWNGGGAAAYIWTIATVLSLPFFIAIYRKSRALGRALAELGVKPGARWQHAESVRRVISEVIPLLSLGGIFILVAALSSSFLPGLGVLALVFVGSLVMAAVFWKRFVAMHSKLQGILMDMMSQDSHHK